MKTNDVLQDVQRPAVLGTGAYVQHGYTTRTRYGHLLHALQYIVSARRETQDAPPLHAVKISMGQRAHHDFMVPKEPQSWLNSLSSIDL